MLKSKTDYTILVGNALDVLDDLPENSVQMVMTSPPYWNQRDYGTGEWKGGDPNCDHHEYRGGHGKASSKQLTNTGTQTYQYKDVCKLCHAVRISGELGRETTVQEYVDNMVVVFRKVRRVLKDDGVVWLNLGDTYINKNLAGIPWRVALALQADGWWLRADVVWDKPNAMPENVKDRPNISHEYIYLLTKNRKYYYDWEAVLVPYTTPINRWAGNKLEATNRSDWDENTGQNTYRQRNIRPNPKGRHLRSVWSINTKPYNGAHFATFPEDLVEIPIKAGSKPGDVVLDPFVGSGTVGVVALRLGRKFIGIDLKPEYAYMAKERIENARIL